MKIRSTFSRIVFLLWTYRRKDKAPQFCKRAEVYSASHCKLFCYKISSLYLRTRKKLTLTSFLWWYSHVDWQIVAIYQHMSFHPRRGQTSGTLALEMLCINYTWIMVTDITLVHCMWHSSMVRQRDGGQCPDLEAGGIRDMTVCGSCLVNMFTAEY